jgi:hypothetical protein
VVGGQTIADGNSGQVQDEAKLDALLHQETGSVAQRRQVVRVMFWKDLPRSWLEQPAPAPTPHHDQKQKHWLRQAPAEAAW